MLETPDSRCHCGSLRADANAGLLVMADGQIAERGAFAEARALRAELVCAHDGGLLVPEFDGIAGAAENKQRELAKAVSGRVAKGAARS